MAIEVKVLKVGSDVLTDLRPGRTRRTVYTPAGQLGPMTLFLLGVGAAAIAPGVARAFTGTTPGGKAREELNDDLLAAKITREQQQADLIQAQIALIGREFDPVSQEQRALKVKAIRDALPLELGQQEVDLEKERAAAARADQLFPLVLEERQAAVRTQQELGNERAERQAEFIQTARVQREFLAEQTERQSLLNQQLEQQTDLIRSAIGPLDAAQAAQFAREVLFPPGKPEKVAPIGALSVPRLIFAGAGF